MQAATFRSQLDRGKGRGIVNVDGHVSQVSDGLCEDGPLIVPHFPQAQSLSVNFAETGDHPLHDLFCGHLQAENRDGPPLLRRFHGHRQHQRSLAHAGPRGEDQQIGALEASQQAIQVPETAGHAHQLATVLAEVLHMVEVAVHHLLDGAKIAAGALLGDREERLFGAIHHLIDGPLLIVGEARDVAGRIQQTPADVGLLDHPPVAFNIDG